MTHTKEKNQPVETDPEMTEVMELADKELKTSIINHTGIFDNVKENMSMMRRDMKDTYFKKNQVGIPWQSSG